MTKSYTRRNTNRIPQHDYSIPGQYFVTICTNEKKEQFGLINDNGMVLNEIGNMIDFWWQVGVDYVSTRYKIIKIISLRAKT